MRPERVPNTTRQSSTLSRSFRTTPTIGLCETRVSARSALRIAPHRERWFSSPKRHRCFSSRHLFLLFFFAFPKDASPATRHARVAKCGKTNKRIRVVVRVVVVQRRESFFFSRPPPWVFIVAKARACVMSRKRYQSPSLSLSFPSFFLFLSLGFRVEGERKTLMLGKSGIPRRHLRSRRRGTRSSPKGRAAMKNESERVRRDDSFPRCRRRLGRRRSCKKQQRSQHEAASVDVDETNCVGGGASAPSADGTIRREMKQLARLTWPIVLQMGSQQIMLACDLIYVGRLGRFENDSRVVVHRLVLVMLVLLGWIDVGNGHFSESSARRKRPESGEKLDDSCSFGGYRRVFPSRGIFVQLGSDSERR